MTGLARSGIEEFPSQSTRRMSMIGKAWGRALLPLVAVLMVVDLYLIFMWAPLAGSEHRYNLQRILYIHVAIAWVALLAFAVVFVASIVYLLKENPRWDALAHASAEVGMIFATLVLVTGSIWAKGIWDQWWTWEPRLTTMLILWLLYAAYLMLRNYAPSPAQGARFSAVIGVVGFIDVPIVYFAANWWRGVHPEVVTGPLAETGSLDSSMRLVLWVTVITFTLLFVLLVRERLVQKRTEDAIRTLKNSVSRARRALI
jgi:heme exporter protein C